MRGGKRDNRKKREDDKRGGYRGGAPLKRHYTLSEEAARIVRDGAKRDGIEREDWLNLLITGMHMARFELRKDEDTGRLYWWGAEDGWKDPTEIGENGVLTLDAQYFAVGTALILTEPIDE